MFIRSTGFFSTGCTSGLLFFMFTASIFVAERQNARTGTVFTPGGFKSGVNRKIFDIDDPAHPAETFKG